MKKVLFLALIIGIICTACSIEKTGFEGSTWTASKCNGVLPSKYAESVDKDTVDVIDNIEFKSGKVTLEERTFFNKMGETPEGVVVDKGGSVAEEKDLPCRLNDGKMLIGEMSFLHDDATDTLSTNIDGVDVTYIRDYGVKGKIFALDKSYKNGRLIYDADKDNRENIDRRKEYIDNSENSDKFTEYEFSIQKGLAFEDSGKSTCKESEFQIKGQKEGKEPTLEIYFPKEKYSETIKYSRKDDTITIENNDVKRIFVAIGGTPLE